MKYLKVPYEMRCGQLCKHYYDIDNNPPNWQPVDCSNCIINCDIFPCPHESYWPCNDCSDGVQGENGKDNFNPIEKVEIISDDK